MLHTPTALESLYEEFKKGDESKYAIYVNYLKNQPKGRIPSEWTPAGKALIETILDRKGNAEGDDSGLPPGDGQKGTYEETWLDFCHGEDTDLARAAYFQFTSRDEDTLMVPFYDMHNHSNDPKKLNTIHVKPDRPGLPFVMRATRDILPGEQVFISYNRCHRCWFDDTYRDCTSFGEYDTPELFDVFGFVEDFPQSWTFEMPFGEEDFTGNFEFDELKFCLERPGGEGAPLVVTFGDNRTPMGSHEDDPVAANIEYLGDQLVRLSELGTTIAQDAALMETMPRHEWDMAWGYHDAMMTSISAALLASGFVDDDEGAEADLLASAEDDESEESDSDDDVEKDSDNDVEQDTNNEDEQDSIDDDNEEVQDDFAAIERFPYDASMVFDLAKTTLERANLANDYGPTDATTRTKSTDSTSFEEGDRDEDKNLAYDGSDLIEWINSNGGLVHPNIRIGLDPSGQYRGVFVKDVVKEGGPGEGIGKGVTASIPW